MTTPRIGLRISGTKQHNDGLQPLVAVGVLAGSGANDMNRVPLLDEKPVYVLKHASDHALYMLIDRRVKSFDADAPGVLAIALTIPSDSRLAGKKSPFTLLQEIYDTFKSNYMTRLSDGRDSFIDKDAESGIFQQIIDRYSLETRPRPLVPMTQQCPTGMLKVPKDKLEAFFRDTNYDEFRKFCDIEVGTECACSPGLDKLDIPKLPLYELWFNGQRTGRYFRQKQGEDTLKIEKQGNPPIYITLKELMEAPNHRVKLDGITIELDMTSDRILFSTQQSVPTRLAFEWNPDDENAKSEALAMIRNGRLKIKLGQNDVSRFVVSGEQVEVDSENIDDIPVTISPESTSKYEFNVSKEIIEQDNQKLLLIIIKVTTKIANTVPTTESKSDIPAGRKSSKKAIIYTLCGILLGLGGIVAIYKLMSKPDDTVAKNAPNNPPAVLVDKGGENRSDDANNEQQKDSLASQEVKDEASNNIAPNAEEPKAKETSKKDEDGGTPGGGSSVGGTSVGGASSGGASVGGTSVGGTSRRGTSGGGTSGGGTSGQSLSKTAAIGVMLSGQGDIDAARKVLLPQEINDIEVVGALNDNSDEANQIISQLLSGQITPATAKTEMQILDRSGGGSNGNGGVGGGGPMSKNTAIRILLGERLGSPKDAEKVLGADAKTVRKIRSTYKDLPAARQAEADPIIEKLKSGALTPTAAAQRLNNIIYGR